MPCALMRVSCKLGQTLNFVEAASDAAIMVATSKMQTRSVKLLLSCLVLNKSEWLNCRLCDQGEVTNKQTKTNFSADQKVNG